MQYLPLNNSIVMTGISNIPIALLTFLNIAALSTSRIRPHASAGVLVEVQASCALHLSDITLDAVVEYVAYRRIGMGKETVPARALICGLRGLCKRE